MIDTSAMLAGLLAQHEFHHLARPQLKRSAPVPAIVLAETYSQLRRTFGLTAEVAVQALGYWIRHDDRIASLPASAYVEVFERAVELQLGSNIHDALIAKTCAYHGLPLATLDRRQHAIAVALGVKSTYLLG